MVYSSCSVALENKKKTHTYTEQLIFTKARALNNELFRQHVTIASTTSEGTHLAASMHRSGNLDFCYCASSASLSLMASFACLSPLFSFICKDLEVKLFPLHNQQPAKASSLCLSATLVRATFLC